MKYFLQRDGRTFGPYSYDDLKRYQAENRIGPNDVIRREDSQQWEPWQQVLTPAPAAAPAPAPDPTPPMPPIQPQQPPFGGGGGFSPPSQGGFGNPPQQGFGAGPSGFGTNPPQEGGFGQQPPAGQGFGGGGFGQPQGPAGGFGSFGAMGAGGAQYGGGYGTAVGAPQASPYGGAVGPMPPDMQWWLVLIIGMFTCGLFLVFWIWKQASFVKRIDPTTDAPRFYLYALILYVSGYLLMLGGAFMAAATGSDIAMVIPGIGQLVLLGGVVFLILAAFKMRAAIHNYYTMVEPMGINLMDTTGAVLTFFFSPYFFQYHFANIAARKKAMGHPPS